MGRYRRVTKKSLGGSLLFEWCAMLLLGMLMASAAFSKPGYREDQRLWLSSVESKTLSIQEDLHELHLNQLSERAELRQEYQAELSELKTKRANAGMLGWPGITDSKEDYDSKIKATTSEYIEENRELEARQKEEMEELALQLASVLATTPSTDQNPIKGKVRPGSSAHENAEIYNALRNLQSTITLLNARMVENPTDLELALDTYRKQNALFSTVLVMTKGFSQRVDRIYGSQLKSLRERVAQQIRRTKRSDSDKSLKMRELEKLKLQDEALEKNIPKLKDMKRWADSNIVLLEGQIDTVQLLMQNVSLAMDTGGFVADINDEFSNLQFSFPEIMDYDLVESDFLIKDAVD